MTNPNPNIEKMLEIMADPGNRFPPQAGIVTGNGYPCQKMRLDVGNLRQVTAKRARTLKKKGVPVRWSGNLGWYTWKFEDRRWLEDRI